MHDLDQLRRWVASGAGWQVRALTAAHVELELLTCDGGEVVAVMVSSDPELRAYVCDRGEDAGRERS
ncbi:MAG: hypothetical protein ACK5LN_04835 [Propioniciclava sp.]